MRTWQGVAGGVAAVALAASGCGAVDNFKADSSDATCKELKTAGERSTYANRVVNDEGLTSSTESKAALKKDAARWTQRECAHASPDFKPRLTVLNDLLSEPGVGY